MSHFQGLLHDEGQSLFTDDFSYINHLAETGWQGDTKIVATDILDRKIFYNICWMDWKTNIVIIR